MKPEPLQLWLFEEPPVTQDEIVDWVRIYAKIDPENWRFPHYVRQWAVAEKIARDKTERLNAILGLRPVGRKNG